MYRQSPHLHLEPEDADIGAHEHLFLWLRNQHSIGLVAAQVRHQRTIAGGLLLDDRLDIHGRRWLQPDATECFDAE